MITLTNEPAVNGGPRVRTKPWPARASIGNEEKTAVMALFDKAIASGEGIEYNGENEEAYCREFAEFMGGGHADAVCSGTAAVYLALRALDIEPFTEVIVSPITDPGGMMPIVMLNCIPVVADTVPGSYNVGPKEIEEKISPQTSAILVAHIGGEPADIEGIMAVARKHKLLVVEDCAQAHGARIDGRLAGTFGDIAAFSTMFSKHYSTGGQGGMVYTGNKGMYDLARRAADRGKPLGLPDGSTNYIASLNFNLDEIGAAIGRVQLRKLLEIIGGRRRVAAGIARGLESLSSVSMPLVHSDSEPSYWFLRLRFNRNAVSCDKAEFCNALVHEGLPIVSDYRAMPHTHDWHKYRRVFGTSEYPWSSPSYKGNVKTTFDCPNALRAIADHFNLQIHENWGDEEIADTIRAIAKLESAYGIG